MDPFESITITQSFKPIFSKAKISQYDLQRVLETSSWAPSPFNSQPWEFVVIQQDEHIREIASLVTPAVDLTHTDFSREQIKKYLRQLPNLFFYLHDTSRQDPGKNAYKLGLISMGTALSNLLLTASAAGIGLQAIYFDYKQEELIAEIRTHLKIPDNLEICCLFGMGYLKERADIVREQAKPMNIHDNTYGNQRPAGKLSPNTVEYNPFFLVKKRKSYRKAFLPKSISTQDENYLLKAAQESFVFNKQRTWELIFIKDKKLIGDFANLITKVSYNVHLDEGYSQRMQSWMRYTHEEKMKKADGILLTLWGKVIGFLLREATLLMERTLLLRPFRILFVKYISKEFFGELLRHAPLIVVVVYNKKLQETSNTPSSLNLISIGTLTQNLLLAGTSREIGAQFLSILLDTNEGREQVRKLLKLPEHAEIIDLMRTGYINPQAPHKLLSVSSNIRRPVERILHYEGYTS